MSTILFISRAKRFSPDAVEKDAAILHSVGGRLAESGHNVRYEKEENLEDNSLGVSESVDAILTMARGPQALSRLRSAEAQGVVVINSPTSVEMCNSRNAIDRLMRSNNLPAAPLYKGGPGWLKADGGHEVHFVPDAGEMERRQAGMPCSVATAHVEGRAVKFYGVAGDFFFPAGHPRLRQAAMELAQLLGILVYGGDAVVRADGTFALVDFNDWPSFAPCREKAAKAISRLTELKIEDV